MSSVRPVQARPASPAHLLDELVELAHRFGRDPWFSRAGGGNASVKSDGVLYLKPSGVPLADLAAADLVRLDLGVLLANLDESADAGQGAGSDPVMRIGAAARLDPPGGRRPSVELLFHALLPQRFVL